MTTTGVLGGRWRATVTPWGALDPWDGSARLDWYVVADDRWHRPEVEPAVRQRRIDGTPVVETRVRIPNGDAVHRVWSVPDAGGMTLVEVENSSPLPIAVVLTRPDLLSGRPASEVPPAGVDLPSGSVSFPVGHHASVRVALGHDRPRAERLPSGVPDAAAVARGWLATAQRTLRLDLPDERLVDAVVAAICDLALDGPAEGEPVDFLLGAGLHVRGGGAASRWVAEVADAAERILGRRAPSLPERWALDAASMVLARAGERRALADLERARPSSPWPISDADAVLRREVEGVRLVAALEHCVARQDGALFPHGVPSSWFGVDLAVHRVPVGPETLLSAAVRWHGARPALLWELDGPPVTLRAPALAPDWSSSAPSGETLWPAPAPSGAGGSFV